MSIQKFSPADAKRQQEEDRRRAAAHHEAKENKLLESRTDSAQRTADAVELIAKLALEKAEAAEKDAILSKRHARISMAISVISVIAAIASIVLSFLFEMNYLP